MVAKSLLGNTQDKRAVGELKKWLASESSNFSKKMQEFDEAKAVLAKQKEDLQRKANEEAEAINKEGVSAQELLKEPEKAVETVAGSV